MKQSDFLKHIALTATRRFRKPAFPRSDTIRYFTVITLPLISSGCRSPDFFTNRPYLAHMPLGFFTVSSSYEPETLSRVILALRHPSEIPLFDAKPPFSEAVTLSPPRLFFVNHCLFPPRSQILNVTALNISLSVK